MSSLESDIEKAACKEILKLGVTSIKIMRADQKGWPDRLFLVPGGRPVFIEFKRPGEEPSIHQKLKLGRLLSLGYAGAVVDNVESAVLAIKIALGLERIE